MSDDAADDRVPALQAALARGAAAAAAAAAGLWALAAAVVLLGTQLAARARDAGDAKALGETIVLDAGPGLIAAQVLAPLAALAALVLWLRWQRAAAAVLPLVGEDEVPNELRPKRALGVLWRAGGDAPRPRTLDGFALLAPSAGLAALVLVVLPRDYGNVQALDLAALLACVLLLAAALLGVGVLRRVSDRHVGRAKHVTGER